MTMTLAEKVGRNIRTLRREKGITQHELAEKLNVGRSNVSFWENGQSLPRTDTLDNIAKFFDVPVELVLGVLDNNELQKITNVIIDNDDISTQTNYKKQIETIDLLDLLESDVQLQVSDFILTKKDKHQLKIMLLALYKSEALK